MLQELLNTPVSQLDPESNPITPGDHVIFLDNVRTDMSNDDPNKVYRYSCTFGIAEGEFAGRKFFDDIYPMTKAGTVSQYAAKQVQTIVNGALGGAEAVEGRTDVGEVLAEIAAANPPLTFPAKTKNETGRDSKLRTRLAV